MKRPTFSFFLISLALAAPPATAQFMGNFGGAGAMGGGGAAAAAAGADTVGAGFRPAVRVVGTYNTALVPASLQTGGELRTFNSWGVGILGGVAGARQLTERTGLGLYYHAAYRYYEKNRSINRFSNTLALGLFHRFSERVSLTSTVLGGWGIGGFGFGSTFGGLGGFGSLGSVGAGFRQVPGAVGAGNGLADSFGTPENNDLVDNEVLDARTGFAAVTTFITYRPTERWSISAGGIGYMVRREGFQFGVNSYGGRLSAGYQISSRSEFGVFYGNNRSDYVNAFGGINVQILAGSFSYSLAPRTRLTLLGGGFHVNSTFVGTVPLDPLLAQLLGEPHGLAIQSISRFSYIAGARIGHEFERSAIQAFYRRGVTPGNGLLLPSTREVAGLTYGYSGIDKWALSVGAFASRTIGIFQSNSQYLAYTVRVSAGYRLYRNTHLQLSAGARLIDLTGGIHNRGQVFVSAGLGWSPGELPLPF
jgi:hypothetical protein